MPDSPSSQIRGRESAEAIAGRAAALSTRLLEVTALVFHRSTPSEPEPIGAAVLLAVGPIRFAISSARVLNERDDHPYVQIGADLASFEGDYSRIPSAADGQVDVGVIRLSGSRWNSLPDSHFTQWLEIDHAGHFLMDYAFALAGYPLKKPDEESQFAPGLQLIAALECGRRLYNQEGHDPNVHLLISLDTRRTWAGGGHLTTPDQYDVTGGGVWSFGKRSVLDVVRPPRLSAIATEVRRKGLYRYVLATRVQMVIDALVQRYADVRTTVLDLARMRPN